MQTKHEQTALIDKLLAGAITPQEERNLREHMRDCTACQQYMDVSRRAITGLKEFSFEVNPSLNAQVQNAITQRVRELEMQYAKRRSLKTFAAALALTTALDPSQNRRRGDAVIGRIENVARACEAGILTAFIGQSGRAADPLTRGKYAPMFWLGAVGCGLVLSSAADALKGKKQRRVPSIASALLTLAGGLALKWAVVHAAIGSFVRGQSGPHP